MFGKILGKNKSQTNHNKELVEKISKMNLTDMRAYVKNKLKDSEATTEGLNELLKKLIKQDEKTKKYYLNSDDMDSKKKKAFDLVLILAKDKRADIETLELVQKFQKVYKDIIDLYDKEHKEIYTSRFDEAIKVGLTNINELAELRIKMNVLGE
ncbi:hypothetical protein [Sulfurimonas sp.]